MRSNLETAVLMSRILVNKLIENGEFRLMGATFELDLENGNRETIKAHIIAIKEIFEKALVELEELEKK